MAKPSVCPTCGARPPKAPDPLQQALRDAIYLHVRANHYGPGDPIGIGHLNTHFRGSYSAAAVQAAVNALVDAGLLRIRINDRHYVRVELARDTYSEDAE